MIELVSSLKAYQRDCSQQQSPDFGAQSEMVLQFLELAEKGPKTLDRSHQEAHFTGSVLIANPELDSVLLTLHAKLGLWLQLGGHADGESDLSAVALREGQEESGIETLRFLHPSPAPIMDLDIHWIPERKGEPGHYHYDVRYLALADRTQPVVITPESKELRWFPLSDAYGTSTQWSMHRQFDKLAWTKKHWKAL